MLSLLLTVTVVASTLLPPDGATASFLAGTNESVLTRQPQLQPGTLGDGSVIGLQYADPAEQMVVMDPPQPSNQGGAGLQHPLLIPAGRGIQPNLVLNYDSTAGSSWVGTGWNLSVGEISIDTRWGVPRYDPAKESETYLLDGAVLSPTAVRGTFQNRVAERSDFTLRVENAYNLIIRHGNYRWALSAQRDVGVNLIRYFYDTVPGTRVGNTKPDATTGKQLYLSRIRYTGALSVAPAPPDDAEYEVRFLRDGAITPAPRRDLAWRATRRC